MMTSDNIKNLADMISSSRHIVAFTGAGISTPSGIPDFRSHSSGLWQNVDPMQVASLYGFKQNPQAFYDWVRPLAQLTMDALPNPAHYALAKLEQMGRLKGIITQNIDMLHTKAGNQVIYELHGHMREATCIHCYKVFPAEAMFHQFLIDNKVPCCRFCGGVLKPNVILFGEQLPYQALQSAKDAAKACDMMLIIGSSLEVAPASDLPAIAWRSNARIAIINLETTDIDRLAEIVIHADAAEVLPAVVERLSTLS